MNINPALDIPRNDDVETGDSTIAYILSQAEWNLIRRLRSLEAGVHSLVVKTDRRGDIDMLAVIGSGKVEPMKPSSKIVESES